jgi:hypothetical protein
MLRLPFGSGGCGVRLAESLSRHRDVCQTADSRSKHSPAPPKADKKM